MRFADEHQAQFQAQQAAMPKGGGAQTPYPLPANMPTIIIQSQ
ncbi:MULTISPECIES: hypothetical protein [unclassified Caballeronia]|nr:MULTISPECIES: hypothetical protein [unclassified Caballeronia]MDR5771018.1 hypothetical protein [Caballeronia sp. LZ002]MDR5802480.1 hypothetical protein [Caballeronia sp. LZ001]MDR5846455.1 hypothetical protein [Caballeronia sp. LZ003]